MKTILGIALAISLGTILAGAYQLKKASSTKEELKKYLRMNVSTFAPLLLFAIMILVPDIAYAAGEGTIASANGLGLIAAALSTGLAALGAGYAVAVVASSAIGAVSEDPKILGKTLIFVGLAEGIAIYGLIISILIIQKV